MTTTTDDCPGCSTCEPCDGTDCECAEGREDEMMSENENKRTQLAVRVVVADGRELAGQTVETYPAGGWSGGLCRVIEIEPDDGIAFTARRLSDGAEIGVRDYMPVRLVPLDELSDQLAAMTARALAAEKVAELTNESNEALDARLTTLTCEALADADRAKKAEQQRDESEARALAAEAALDEPLDICMDCGRVAREWGSRQCIASGEWDDCCPGCKSTDIREMTEAVSVLVRSFQASDAVLRDRDDATARATALEAQRDALVEALRQIPKKVRKAVGGYGGRDVRGDLCEIEMTANAALAAATPSEVRDV